MILIVCLNRTTYVFEVDIRILSKNETNVILQVLTKLKLMQYVTVICARPHPEKFKYKNTIIAQWMETHFLDGTVISERPHPEKFKYKNDVIAEWMKTHALYRKST